jgi:hypothetical protein
MSNAALAVPVVHHRSGRATLAVAARHAVRVRGWGQIRGSVTTTVWNRVAVAGRLWYDCAQPPT